MRKLTTDDIKLLRKTCRKICIFSLVLGTWLGIYRSLQYIDLISVYVGDKLVISTTCEDSKYKNIVKKSKYIEDEYVSTFYSDGHLLGEQFKWDTTQSIVKLDGDTVTTIAIGHRCIAEEIEE